MTDIMASRRWFLKAIGVTAAAALTTKPAVILVPETVVPEVTPDLSRLPPNLLHVWRRGQWDAVGGILNLRHRLDFEPIDVTYIGRSGFFQNLKGPALSSFEMELLRHSATPFEYGKERFAISMSGTSFFFEAMTRQVDQIIGRPSQMIEMEMVLDVVGHVTIETNND